MNDRLEKRVSQIANRDATSNDGDGDTDGEVDDVSRIRREMRE